MSKCQTMIEYFFIHQFKTFDLGSQKNRLIETVLLSTTTHFDSEIRKVKDCQFWLGLTEVKLWTVQIIVNIFLPISFNICFGFSKEPLIETVLLSTHNICFD